MISTWLGLDIGGANLKLADLNGGHREREFALWKAPDQLSGGIRELLAGYPAETSLAVTMTGELADCYRDATTGVRAIANAVVKAAPGAKQCLFYDLAGRFSTFTELNERPDDHAASNWHALASLVSRSLTDNALLIDIGSTTCDIIPLEPGRVATTARTDFDRLIRRQLVYVGVRRTPVCAIVDTLPFAEHEVPVMNELFSTVDDCALLLGLTADSGTDLDTADGRPRTRSFACGRMSKMLGLDHRKFAMADAVRCAQSVITALRQKILSAIAQQGSHSHWILSGHGSPLLESDLPTDVERCQKLRAIWGEGLSRVAPAYAVACLASELASPRQSPHR